MSAAILFGTYWALSSVESFWDGVPEGSYTIPALGECLGLGEKGVQIHIRKKSK